MLPDDDLSRAMTVAQPETDYGLPHVAVVGDVYTILVPGEQTAGRYALIDMFVPPGDGPPPHRHDFEEMFHVPEGEVEVLFRGARSTARAGATVNIPANAPHAFTNGADKPARLLWLVAPAGLESSFWRSGTVWPREPGHCPSSTRGRGPSGRRK